MTVAERLASVLGDVADATRAAGRDPADVRVIAVSKRVSVERILEAAEAGHRDFGESYVQHALPKIAELEGRGLVWHLVGRLQSNKARKAAGAFDWLHALDSLSAAKAVSRAAVDAASDVSVLLQVLLGPGDERGGVEPDEAARLLECVSDLPGLRVRGVMGVAPRGAEPRPHFARLRETAERLRALGLPRTDIVEISAGMSGDYREAVAEGATMVRIGTAIFGERD